MLLLLEQRVGADEMGNFQFGLKGTWNGTSGTVTKNIVAIQCLGEVVITTATEIGATGNLNGLTIPAGTIIYGKFTQVVIASGQCRLYLGDN